MCFIFVIDGKCFVRFSFLGQVTGRGNLLEPPPSHHPRPVACEGVALITSLAWAAGRYYGVELSWVESQFRVPGTYLFNLQITNSSIILLRRVTDVLDSSEPHSAPLLCLAPFSTSSLVLHRRLLTDIWLERWRASLSATLKATSSLSLHCQDDSPPLSLQLPPNKHALCWDYAQPSLARGLRGALCRTHFVRNLFCLLYFSFFSSPRPRLVSYSCRTLLRG